MGRKILNLLTIMTTLNFLAGCSTLPNSCGDEGVNCMPVRKVIDKVERRSFHDLNRPPSQKDKALTSDSETVNTEEDTISNKQSIRTVISGEPLLTMPRQWRLWINRYEDADGDWNDETYLILRLDQGRWRIGINGRTLTR